MTNCQTWTSVIGSKKNQQPITPPNLRLIWDVSLMFNHFPQSHNENVDQTSVKRTKGSSYKASRGLWIDRLEPTLPIACRLSLQSNDRVESNAGKGEDVWTLFILNWLKILQFISISMDHNFSLICWYIQCN